MGLKQNYNNYQKQMNDQYRFTGIYAESDTAADTNLHSSAYLLKNQSSNIHVNGEFGATLDSDIKQFKGGFSSQLSALITPSASGMLT